ncbi:4Fe-4S dicluster domain-containing protein [Anaeroselena agilis]|uniref:Reductive dehalogenase domain-containing protein n=1 Tax=Anaeroselena agilis TaxID=3063788 RepID=A0ABU3P5Q1_9FIRM|nr:reductive dehalogenase domain-containing protein [Selenomonadales bacterium 4137-cl]
MLTMAITAGWVLASVAAVLFAWLAATLYRERETRRLPRVLATGAILLALWAGALAADYPYKLAVLAIAEAAAAAVVMAFFLPAGTAGRAALPADMPRLDERDVMFARAGYRDGTAHYHDYYSRRPENREQDDRIRALPGLCSPGAATYQPIHAGIAGSGFRFLADMRPLAEGQAADNKQASAPEEMTAMLKGLARYHGAKVVGVAALRPYHFYSHRGRHPENYGEEVASAHKFAVVFAVEMDWGLVRNAPLAPVVMESCRQYIEAAKIGMVLAYFLRELGYDARNHMDGSYLVCAPLVAHDAGVGELGRMGIVITRDYGPRVRLGVVTTDLPLIADVPTALGVQDACSACEKCARSCPAQAIPYGGRAEHNGVSKWRIDQARCYEFWCRVGTDCAVCMNVCPYSKPDTLLHRLFRYSLRQSSLARRAMVHLDDYFYGRRPTAGEKPDWL